MRYKYIKHLEIWFWKLVYQFMYVIYAQCL